MSKPRVRRTKEELKQELIEQLQLLELSCRSYDSGMEAAGKHIALSIRVLVHQHGQSQALMQQLDLRECPFVDSAGKLNPRNLLPEHHLVAIRMRVGVGERVRYIPAGRKPWRSSLRIRFQDWWNEPILKDSEGHLFSRRDLVGNVANTDGGAHVDPELDEAYMQLSRKNSLGWLYTEDDILKKLEGRPELAAMRQIAYELLLTIAESYPDLAQHFAASEPTQP